jgi:ParB-like chromosome segregation protein Spo0J
VKLPKIPETGSEPISEVRWVHVSTLRPNAYNPNHVAAPEMKLLALSILEDGWTQPIVIQPDGEIVDGFHRYTISCSNPDIKKKYRGWVPTVTLRIDPVHGRMSTIRHNRARGVHGILPMADIVRYIIESGCSIEDLMKRLGMEKEEVDRLADRSGMPDISGKLKGNFGSSWQPVDQRKKKKT